MIDLDRLDEQLELALTDELRLLRGTTTTVAPPRPAEPQPEPMPPRQYVIPAPPPAAAAPRPAPAPVRPVARPRPTPAPAPPPVVDLDVPVTELVARGHFDDAEAAMSHDGGPPVAWKTMRAVLEGRRDEARAAITSIRRLASANDERYWTQRFWVALEWGDGKEQFEVLDHCRERAYRYDELRWRGALTVQLARMNRIDEAARELAATLPSLDGRTNDSTTTLDVATNLVEAAAVLGDIRAATTLAARLRGDDLVVVGEAWICKGAMARFQALAAATVGQWAAADRYFESAIDTHRRLGAQPLLARTLVEWSTTLAGRDPARAHRLLHEGITLADGLRLTTITGHQHALAG